MLNASADVNDDEVLQHGFAARRDYAAALLDANIGYAARGWHTIEIRHDVKQPCHKGWRDTATADADIIRRLRSFPNGRPFARIGIPMGRQPNGEILIALGEHAAGTLDGGARTRGLLYLIPPSGPKIEHEIVVLLGDPHDGEPAGDFLEAVRAFAPRMTLAARHKTHWSWGKRWQDHEALVVFDEQGGVLRLLPLEARTVVGTLTATTAASPVALAGSTKEAQR